MDYDKLYDKTLLDENQLILPSFSKGTAFQLGLIIDRLAREASQSIGLEIELCGQVVFKFSHPTATPNNDLWVARKRNMVHIRQMSTLRAYAMLQRSGADLEKDWFMNPKDYVAVGGGFPICIQDVGIVGSICLSGVPPMNHFDDHELIVSALRELLKESAKDHA